MHQATHDAQRVSSARGLANSKLAGSAGVSWYNACVITAGGIGSGSDVCSSEAIGLARANLKVEQRR